MIIDFPDKVQYKLFYRFLLRKMAEFVESGSTDSLIINLQQTDYVAPNVICDLLSFFNYLHSVNNNAKIFLSFGSSMRLRSYLENAWFFLHSERGSLFSTDLLNHGIGRTDSKSANTNKIVRITIPPISLNKSNSHLPPEAVNQIRRQVDFLFSEQKSAGMHKYGHIKPEQIATAFTEIIDNAYVHSHDFRSCGCYYTFQNYLKSGLNFACSDSGIGFYESLYQKFFSQDSKIKPKLFTADQFRGFASDKRLKQLAGILESIVYRVGEGISDDFGFPFIFCSLVLPNNGELIIHCENTLLKVDCAFLEKYFAIRNGKVIGFNHEKLRSLVLSYEGLRMAIAQGSVSIYDYYFPGVHMSVQIGVN